MPPAGNSRPGSYSSSPVENTATLSGLYTARLARPTDAASPTSCGRNRRFWRRMTEPAPMSSPAERMLAPRLIPGRMTTASPSGRQSSCMMTVSGPRTIWAPVKMRTACRAATAPVNGWPAVARPTTASRVSALGSRSSKATA